MDSMVFDDGAAVARAQTAAQIASGLAVGAPAPVFALGGVYGETQTLTALLAAHRPVLLIFAEPTSPDWMALLPEIGRWQRALTGRITVALLSSGSAATMRPLAVQHELAYVLLQQSREVAAQFGVSALPAAVLLNPAGRITRPPAVGLDAVRTLANQIGAAGPSLPAAGRATPATPAAAPPATANPQAATMGTALPEITLPDLTGQAVSLASFRGEPLLLLFWNPNGASYNWELIDELRQWETNRSPGSPRLLVVASGTAEANRPLGLRSPILLDPEWRVGYAFGGVPTPSAVLIGADGRSSMEVESGAQGILELLGGSSLVDDFRTGRRRIGKTAPAFTLPDLDGTPVSLSEFRGHPTLVLFWSPDCGYCARMLPAFKAWEAQPPADAPAVLVVSSGAAAANRALGFQARVVLDADGAVRRAFRAFGTPVGVLLDAEGRFASPTAEGAAAVFALANGQDLDTVTPEAAERSMTVRVGDVAPAIALPDLEGETVRLDAFHGHNVLLVFWNPGCGFCQRLLPDLRRWEAQRTADDPQLLVVSTGDIDHNRAQGLRAPILLDQHFTVGEAFGVRGTPSAVLIDAVGRVASEISVGAPEVLALATAALPAGAASSDGSPADGV